MSDTDWDERYRSADLPWDTGRRDDELARLVEDGTVSPCAALEVGCGTGSNVLWLAQQGFDTVGVDISPTAIEMAREKLAEAEAEGTLFALDFLENPVPGKPFGFVFDRGCLHSFDAPEERARFASAVAAHLEPGGLWLSLVGNADDPPREVGPPRRTATDIVLAVEPHFEILELESTHFDKTIPDPRRAWRCLMRKRDNTQGTEP